MYQVSDAYKAAVKKQSREWKAKISIGYKDGTSADFTDDAIMGGITIYSQAVSGDAGASIIDIGAAPETRIEFTIIDSDSDLHRYAGAVLSLTVSLKLESGEYEDVPMGVFWVDTGQISRQGTHINIVAYDAMMSYNYVLTDSFRASLKGMTAAEAAYQLTLYSKARIRQDMDISGYPNSDLALDFSDTQIVTGWDAIMWIAQLMGCFVHIGRLNTLEFVQIKSTWRWYNEEHTLGTILAAKNITSSERYKTTFSDDRIHIIGVSMRDGNNNLVTARSGSLETDSNVVIALEKNPLIKSYTRGEILGNIITPLKTTYFYAFQSEILNDPALDVGDTVRLQGGEINGVPSNEIVGFITHSTWRYRGRQEIVNTGQATDMESDTAPTSGDAPFCSTPKTQTEKRIDALEGKADGASDRLVAPDGSMWVLKDDALCHYTADGTYDCSVNIHNNFKGNSFDVKINLGSENSSDNKNIQFVSDGNGRITAGVGCGNYGISLSTKKSAVSSAVFWPIIRFSSGGYNYGNYEQIEFLEDRVFFEYANSDEKHRYRVNLTKMS